MKIIHFTSGFDINYPGGITNYVRSLHEDLLASGINSKIISSEKEDDIKEIVNPDYTFYVDKFRRFSYKFCRNNSNDSHLIEYIEKEKPDLIHFHSIYGVSESFIQYIVGSGIPYLVSLHDYYLGCPKIFMMDRSDAPCRTIDIRKCENCISTLENSDFLRKVSQKFNFKLPVIKNHSLIKRFELMDAFLTKAKIVLPVSVRVKEIFESIYSKPNYLSLNIGNSSASFFIKKRKENNGVINISFLGTLNKHKGADLFIEIVSRVKNEKINFLFHGRTDNKYQVILSESGVNNCGPYNPTNLARILENVDVGFVLPIWEDNGPQVVMELLNNGIPVVGTKVGGIPDFIQHGVTGYLFSPDSKCEIDALIMWLNNLDEEQIDFLMNNIQPLKTVHEHSLELINIYGSLM